MSKKLPENSFRVVPGQELCQHDICKICTLYTVCKTGTGYMIDKYIVKYINNRKMNRDR